MGQSPEGSDEPLYMKGVHHALHHAERAGKLDTHGPSASTRLQLGRRVLHAKWTEIIILILVTVELSITFVEWGLGAGFVCIYRREGSGLCESIEDHRTHQMIETFGLVGRLVICIFMTEMALKIYVGQGHFFENPWHMLDLFIVCTNALCAFFLIAMAEASDCASLLYFLRNWRFVKIWKLTEEEKELLQKQVEGESGESVPLCAESKPESSKHD
eukprot:TRINITY_DN51392_c0_g1_i1.p1 TRINITY_DN51392_c0_g1~~TRINITY_DN51392_c0_g1_i1.p1  ORF type:complete len:216 (-),score=22.90 TRINITY_DN51392_c0_g1_i1:93-740(-)